MFINLKDFSFQQFRIFIRIIYFFNYSNLFYTRLQIQIKKIIFNYKIFYIKNYIYKKYVFKYFNGNYMYMFALLKYRYFKEHII